MDKCKALAHPLPTLAALAPTSSPLQQQRFFAKATSPAPEPSRIVPSSQAIRRRNSPVKYREVPTEQSDEQHGATLSKPRCDEAAQLRSALRRSRRQKATINVPFATRTPGYARARRRRGTGSRRWRPSLRGFARPGRCCRRRSTAARASSRTSRARSASAASSAARPATAAPNGPGSRSAPKSTTSAARCVRVRTVRAALCAERRRGIHPRRDRGPGPQARDPPTALAPELRLRVVAHGSVGASGAAACSPQHPTGPASGRASCSSTVPACAPCTASRVDVRPGAGGLAGDAGRQPEALRGAVRAAGRGDPRAPEQGGAAPRRRDQSWRVQELRGARPLEPGLAVDLGQQRRGLLPYRPPRAAPRRRTSCSPKPSSTRSSSATATAPTRGWRASRGAGDPCVLLVPHAPRFYRVRGRPGGADAMVPRMDRADRGDLPAQRGAAGALRPRASSARRRRSTRRRAR